MPWLTAEEILVRQAVTAYRQALEECGAVIPFQTEVEMEAFLNGYWMALGMGPAPVYALEVFQRVAGPALLVSK